MVGNVGFSLNFLKWDHLTTVCGRILKNKKMHHVAFFLLYLMQETDWKNLASLKRKQLSNMTSPVNFLDFFSLNANNHSKYSLYAQNIHIIRKSMFYLSSDVKFSTILLNGWAWAHFVFCCPTCPKMRPKTSNPHKNF